MVSQNEALSSALAKKTFILFNECIYPLSDRLFLETQAIVIILQYYQSRPIAMLKGRLI
jgi:hypothetical protein